MRTYQYNAWSYREGLECLYEVCCSFCIGIKICIFLTNAFAHYMYLRVALRIRLFEYVYVGSYKNTRIFVGSYKNIRESVCSYKHKHKSLGS